MHKGFLGVSHKVNDLLGLRVSSYTIKLIYQMHPQRSNLWTFIRDSTETYFEIHLRENIAAHISGCFFLTGPV